eukprot:2473944-Lingulodinium_polyedra.AAC.1
MTHHMIITKSSAMLERDFEHMRQLMASASSQLSDDELTRRLRLALNAPKVLDPNSKHAANRFIQKVREFMQPTQ